MQSSQQHVAPCVKEVECGLGKRGLKIVAAFSAGIPVSTTRTVEVTQEVDEVLRHRRAVIGTNF